MFDYLTYVEDGLKQDHYDIRMLTFLMVVRLSILCPTIVLQRLDRLVQPLKTIDSFDAKQFIYIVLKYQFLELLCLKTEAQIENDLSVEQVVK